MTGVDSMTFFGAWIFLCLTLGVVFFFIIGIFFLKKEAEWSKLEKDREGWTILTEIINFILARKPEIGRAELRYQVRNILNFMSLDINEEYIELLVNIAVKENSR